MRTLTSACVAVALTLLTSVAQADPATTSRLRALFEEATTHYQLAEYRPALQGYIEAYRIKRDAVFLYNIAQCYRQLGEPIEAARFYHSYLRDAPDARNRAEVEGWIAKMDAAAEAAKGSPSGTLAPEAVSKPAPSTASSPPEKRGKTSSKSAVVASEKPRPAEKRPVVPPPETHAVVVPPPETHAVEAVTAPPPAAPVARSSRRGVAIGVGVAVGVAVVGAGLGVGLGVGLGGGGGTTTTYPVPSTTGLGFQVVSF